MQVTVWKVDFTPGQTHLIPLELPADLPSLDAASLQLPGGAYTTFRTYQQRKALRLEDHFERLEETARLAGHAIGLDCLALRSALRQVVRHSAVQGDMRLRLTLDLEQTPGTVYILAEPLPAPHPETSTRGVRVIHVALQRQTPKAKLTRFIERAGPVRQSLPEDVNEAIMVGTDGRLLEGLSSNFFAIRSGELWTAEEGVLSGITRQLALECAAALDIQAHREPIFLNDIPHLEEAFITSSSRGVLPVRQFDDWNLPAHPGPLTRKIMNEFEARIDQLVELI